MIKEIKRIKDQKQDVIPVIKGRPSNYNLSENKSVFSRIGNNVYHYIKNGGKLYRSKFDLDSTSSKPEWSYQIIRVGFNYSSTAGDLVYIPMTYVFERTSLSGSLEYQHLIAPYNGSIEKILFRSEAAFDGSLEYKIWEASDGTEDPATLINTTTVDLTSGNSNNVAANTAVETHFGKNVLVKGRTYALSFEPNNVDTNDTILTVVIKWDVNS